jgi:hypothetical protein
MKFYNFNDIKSAADCAKFAADVYGAKVSGGRCAATWRNGTNPESVAISKEQFFDHSAKSGGGILQLAMFKCGDMQAAQEFLGEYYHLTPKMQTGAQPTNNRHDDLIRQGFREVARYNYHDLQGNIIHFVARLEHPEHKKQFCQGTPEGWGVKGVTLIPYNLKEITESPWCCIVEGEKSADCLIQRGIPATTVCGGAKKWESSYAEYFRNKQVCVMPDNDAPGREHAQIVAAGLAGIASEIRIVATSLAPKGDVYNYLVDEGHSVDDVYELIANTPVYESQESIFKSVTDTGPTPEMLKEAKSANAIPFRNFIPSEVEVERRGGKRAKEIQKESRTHRAMVDDIHKRFLGFPYKMGKTMMFDHDRDTGEIIELDRPVQLKSWIARRSHKNAEFARADNLCTETELFESLVAESPRFESISLVPDWPKRSDVYYAHDKMPEPTTDHKYLNEFTDFFIPATEYDRCLIKAFICCPLWYIPGIPRPSWIIDSKDGQGSGKSKVAQMISQLYGAPPITVTRSDLEYDQKEIRKRCVSRAGRNARIFLVDNVVGNFKCPELAALISYDHISGLAPYGHGEESRENNLVFCVTTNSATVDTDIADRSLFIYVSHPTAEQCDGWNIRIQEFMQKHRLNVISDIIDMVSKHQPFHMKTRTRFSEFEQRILQPCCGDAEMVKDVLDHVFAIRSESNVEEEYARAILDVFTFNLKRMGFADGEPVFIHSPVVNSWGGQALSELRDKKDGELPVQIIRNLAKKRILSMVDATVRQWPQSSAVKRYAGIPWGFTETTEIASVITFNHERQAVIKQMEEGALI